MLLLSSHVTITQPCMHTHVDTSSVSRAHLTRAVAREYVDATDEHGTSILPQHTDEYVDATDEHGTSMGPAYQHTPPANAHVRRRVRAYSPIISQSVLTRKGSGSHHR
jgi:hypothetical protein